MGIVRASHDSCNNASWRSLRPPFFERIPVPSELAPSSRIDQVVLAFDDPWAPVAVFREDVNLEKAVTARSGTRDDLHAQKSLRVLFDKVMQATLASKRRALNLTGGFVDSDRLRLHDCPSVRSARSYMTRALTPLYVKTVVQAAKSAAWRAR